jgi:hypothetical protein
VSVARPGLAPPPGAPAALDTPRPDVASPLPARCCRGVDRAAHRRLPPHRDHLRLPLRGNPVTGTDETRFTALCPCGQLVEWVAGLAQDGRTGAAPVVHDCASTGVAIPMPTEEAA